MQGGFDFAAHRLLPSAAGSQPEGAALNLCAKRIFHAQPCSFCDINHLFYLWIEIIQPVNEKVKYWRELSDYDLETAVAMLKSKRYLYVGFMCHQAAEKIFKAYHTKLNSEIAPLSHSLSYLAKNGGFYDSFSEEQKDFIDQIEPLNIEARYPIHKERLLKSLTYEKCTEIIEKTRQLQKWIKMKL